MGRVDKIEIFVIPAKAGIYEDVHQVIIGLKTPGFRFKTGVTGYLSTRPSSLNRFDVPDFGKTRGVLCSNLVVQQRWIEGHFPVRPELVEGPPTYGSTSSPRTDCRATHHFNLVELLEASWKLQLQGFAGLSSSYRISPVSRVSVHDGVGLILTILDSGFGRNDAWGGGSDYHL